jgi:predicted N-formylglutamate amidohydrolase
MVLSGRADAGLVIVCDHAANAFPEGYGTLGLPPAALERHIAYDIGAAELTRRLARLMRALLDRPDVQLAIRASHPMSLLSPEMAKEPRR